ncbi:hypothetical protein JCM9279_000155 [Rhodotorula babjevae]
MSPSTSPPSPPPAPPSHSSARAPFYKLSSLSELELANLSLADMFTGYRPSAIDDADLDSDLDAGCDFPALTLGESVVEEAEHRFHERAHEALVFAATPNGSKNNSAAPSALSSPTRTGFFSPTSTSSSSSSRASLSPSASTRIRPRPSYTASEAADPSYFALSRASLYSDVDSSYSGSSATTPSLWSAYSPSLSGASSAFTGTPADSAACSPLGPRSPANGLAVPAAAAKKAAPPPPLSLALAQLELGAAPAVEPQQEDDASAAPKTATIAARRSGASALKLSLSLPPLRTSTSFSSLRVQGGSKSPAAPAALSHLSAPSSPSRVAAARSSWVRDLEVRAADVQDGVRLKKKRAGGFAF